MRACKLRHGASTTTRIIPIARLAISHPKSLPSERRITYTKPLFLVLPRTKKWGTTRTTYFGASLESLRLLGARQGYSLLGTDRNGVNAFFAQRDLLRDLRFPELPSSQAFHSFQYPAYPHADGPFEEL